MDEEFLLTMKIEDICTEIHTLVFDFDGVFTDNCVWVDEYGCESVRCNRADGLALDMLRRFKESFAWDLEVFILSKEKNAVVEKRAKKLKVECKKGEDNKGVFLKEYLLTRFGDVERSRRGLVFVGNDINDISAMRLAGIVCVPADAHQRTLSYAHYVSKKKGGDAFVRDVIDWLLDTEEMTEEQLESLLH